MLATVWPLYAAYPDRPDVRKAIDEARAMLEVDLRAVKVWESGLYQRGDLRPLLGRIQCPTLVVCGALDLIGGPAQSNQIAPRVADAELLILLECGHMPALDGRAVRTTPVRNRALPDRAKRHGNSLCKEDFKRWFVGVGYVDYSGL